MLAAYEASGRSDSAVMTHHALHAGDQQRIRSRRWLPATVARSGAYQQAAEFYRIAMEFGGDLSAEAEAELLELLAASTTSPTSSMRPSTHASGRSARES